ncbi:hypothetical protein ACWFPY_17875 [Nocardia fluminea]
MARTLDITTFYKARFAFMQSIAWENHCAEQNIDTEPYPPGVVPSSTLAAGLEAMEQTWYAEMPTPPTP